MFEVPDAAWTTVGSSDGALRVRALDAESERDCCVLIVRQGLLDTSLLSLESAVREGHFVTADAATGRVALRAREETAAFEHSATFAVLSGAAPKRSRASQLLDPKHGSLLLALDTDAYVFLRDDGTLGCGLPDGVPLHSVTFSFLRAANTLTIGADVSPITALFARFPNSLSQTRSRTTAVVFIVADTLDIFVMSARCGLGTKVELRTATKPVRRVFMRDGAVVVGQPRNAEELASVSFVLQTSSTDAKLHTLESAQRSGAFLCEDDSAVCVYPTDGSAYFAHTAMFSATPLSAGSGSTVGAGAGAGVYLLQFASTALRSLYCSVEGETLVCKALGDDKERCAFVFAEFKETSA